MGTFEGCALAGGGVPRESQRFSNSEVYNRVAMSGQFRWGDLAAAPEEGRLVGPSGAIHLRPRTMEVLAALAGRAGEVVPKRSLLDEVWGEAAVSEAVLTNAIAELRRGFAAVGGTGEVVETVPKRGYRFAAAVDFDVPPPDAHRSLAVLPFDDLSPDRTRQSLVAALHEALIGELAGVSGYRVLPRAATARSAAPTRPLAALARTLRVERLLVGSLLGDGTRLRVNAQLVDPVADRVRWSTSLVVAYGDPLEAPATLARALAPEVTAMLSAVLPPSPAARPALDEATSARLLRGQFLLRGSTVERLQQGIADLEEVLRRQPDLVPALAGLARGKFLLASWCADPGGECLTRAEAAAARALALDRDSVEAHVWWTMTRAFARRRVDEAVEPLLAVTRAHPHDPEARDALAHCLAILGRIPEAIAEERRALVDDPLSPALRAALGFFLRAAGELAAAAGVLIEAVELHPEWTIARLELARVRWARGERVAAAREIGAVDAAWGELTGALARGRIGAARRLLEKSERDRTLAPYWLAERWLWLGDSEKALAALERALPEGQLRLAYAGCDPTFAPLAAEPRFRALLQRAGVAR